MIKAYAAWFKELDSPKLCLYVFPAIALQAPDLEIIKSSFKNTKIVHLGRGLHFIQEDYPHEIGENIGVRYQEVMSQYKSSVSF